MDNKQVAFIICTNDMQYYGECERYIQDLEVPEGYSTDIITIQEADSMTQGYNAGMQASEAKYKVYLHHDTFILNTRFIYDILEVFETDETIGMIGVLGGSKLPTDAKCYKYWNVGSVLANNGSFVDEVKASDAESQAQYTPVMAVDGMLMVTQVDIPWREDFLDGWDFYDVSQALEMRRNGYQVVVPYQKTAWCYHDCGPSKLGKYDYYRHKVIVEYKEYFQEENVEEQVDNKEEIISIRNGMIRVLEAGAFDELCSFIESIFEYSLSDGQIEAIRKLMEIYTVEKKNVNGIMSEWWVLREWKQMYTYYNWLRFVVLRLGFKREDERIAELEESVREGRISKDAVRLISQSVLKDVDGVYERLIREEYEEPLVSVILSTYNGGAFVGETIESILNQIYRNLEVIIVDDASTDNSRAVIDSFQDARIKRIYSEKNQHVCYSGNAAFSEATGKYVALIGHDDIWVPNKLEKQIAFMEEHPEYSVCFSWVNVIDEEKRIVPEANELMYRIFNNKENRTQNLWLRYLIQKGNTFCAPSACIRKDLLDKEGFYRYSYVQLQDYELWIRILTVGPVYVFYERLTNYRRFQKKEQNLSAINNVSRNRTSHEMQCIRDSFIEKLSTEQFVKIFGNMMHNPSARTEKEIQCEKAFLLWELGNCFSIKHFVELMEDEECRKIMEEQYGFGLQEFYKLNAKPILFDTTLD